MKRPLIILHGALGAKSQFEKLAKKLEPNFEVRLLNFEGHGGRISEREFSIDHFSQNLSDFIKEEKLKQVLVFGYSMGGYVAINTALNYPGFIQKIITLGTKFDWNPDSAAQEFKMLDPEKIKEKVPQFAESLKKRHAPGKWEEVLNKTAPMMHKLGDGDALNFNHFELLDIPVKIMVGEMDKMVSIEESKNVAKWIPGAEFEILKNCKHPIEQCDQELLTQKISDFL